MRHVVCDIETNGLLDEATCIHSMVLRDVDTDEVLSCVNHTDFNLTPERTRYAFIEDGLAVLDKAERIYMHNGIKFDRPVLKKLEGYEIPWEKVRDTLVIAAMRWAHIKEMDYSAFRRKLPCPTGKLLGSHSLEAWGIRLGILKGDYGKTTDWSEWTPDLQKYCEQDTAVTAALVRHIRKHGVSLQAVEVEQELALYLHQQERNGWPFDLEKAVTLQGKLAARREELHGQLVKVFGSWWRGTEFTPKKDNKTKGVTAGCPYTKLELVQFNPGSRQHIAQRLTKLYGWEPTEFTESGQPEVNEKTILSLDQTLPGVSLLNEYLLVVKRLGQLAEGDKSWLKLATKDRPEGGKLTGLHHIHGGVKQSATITHRAAHVDPNTAQVPKVGKPFGKECRELFHVPSGWIQMGADASSLEARCLAHYMAKYDGGAYGKLLLEGDVHSVNRDALGLPQDKMGRDRAKTWFYAFMYGAGDAKLGRILDPTSKDPAVIGGQKKKQFFKATPALANLIADVKRVAKAQGYLTSIDGRKVYVRSDHSSLNTLLQCAGAVICKHWIVHYSKRLVAEFGPQGWAGKWAALGWIHDESQLAVRPEVADRIKTILVEEMRALTEKFQWRVQLDGEAKTGLNWADCH